jgi:hypothetical protein
MKKYGFILFITAAFLSLTLYACDSETGQTEPPSYESGKLTNTGMGSLRWKNRVIYSGVINISGGNTTVEADAEFIYEATEQEAALSESSPENAMIGTVTASFIPDEKN